ncbi:MAG: hypothetical protein AOA66_1223 [Candidatus Bathyarchaeota archaeon BA2]|nr:MAG: hypothetical protein AOA66_1223 [Candidatus Bathyarchaeota archaeon BA2]
MEREEFLNRLVTDLNYTASVTQQLISRPKALREVLQDDRVRKRVLEDPVFFAVLMCNDKWLVNAPDHQKLLRDTHPRQVAVCGRGWGKSLVFSRKNLWLIYTKPKIESLIISSTQRQSMIMFDYCYFTVQSNPLMRDMIQRPGTTRTTIRLKSSLGGRLVALPCSPNKLRGFHPDWVFCDEASIIPSDMITSEIIPMLTKPNSHFVMSGTPKSFDHIFHRAFLERKRYSIHHYPSYTSSLVSKEQLAEWQQDMTKEEWAREVEAQWIEIANVFFPIDLIITCLDPELGDPDSSNRFLHELEGIQPKQLKGTFYAGLDMGKQIDHSVLAVIQKTNNKRRLVYKYQFPLGTPYPSVIAHVTKANQIFQFSKLYIDKTGVGDAIVDEIKEIGFQDTEGIFLTDRWKEGIFTYLKLLMEQKRLSILPDDTQLITQINEQRYEYLKPKTAQERIHLKFYHPPKRHDDQLFALALACYASKEEETKATLKRAY